ncbi:MAG: c-type cytochrome [Acidimicrobiales bacterium]
MSLFQSFPRAIRSGGAALAVTVLVGVLGFVIFYPSQAQTASVPVAQPSTGPSSITFSQHATAPAITYHNPSKTLVPEGRTLFVENCASCHGVNAAGSSRAPNLQGLGAATIDFWVYTGRMPLADPTVQAMEGHPRFTRQQTLAIAAYVVSRAPGGPAIPDVNLGVASLSEGQSLFSTNCAACHTITGVGDALANNVYAPSLYGVGSTQIAEAMRTGPGNMPRFGPGTLSNFQVASIAKYVLYLQKPQDPGGLSLGHVGPVTEGFVGILLGLGGLMLFGFWIGGRAAR